jgi:hypothetical protein
MWRRPPTARSGSAGRHKDSRAASIRQPENSKRFRSDEGRRRMGSSSAPMAVPGLPKAARMRLREWMPRQRRSRCFRCHAISRGPTSIRSCSTSVAFSGSPGRRACTAASTPRPARSMPGRRRAAPAPMASPSPRQERSGTPRSPATISRGWTLPRSMSPSSSHRAKARAHAASGRIRRVYCG